MESLLPEAFVALASAIFSAILTYFISLYKEYKKEIDEQNAVLSAILNELVALYLLILDREDNYEKDCSKNDPNNLETYYFVYFPITYNYFNVYESLTRKFGSIDNRLLVNNIISTYIDLKGFFENLKDLEYYAKEGNKTAFFEPYSVNHKHIVKVHYDYASFIKETHLQRVKDNLTKTIDALKKELKNINDKRTKNQFFKSLFD